jgi:hypothetical protein
VVPVEQQVEIDAGQHVAVEHQHCVTAQPVGDIADATAGTQRLGLDHIFEFQPERGAVAEVFGEDLGPVAGSQHHMSDTRLADARQQVGEQRDTRGRQHGLGRGEGQRPQPGAFTANEDDRIHCHVARIRGSVG